MKSITYYRTGFSLVLVSFLTIFSIVTIRQASNSVVPYLEPLGVHLQLYQMGMLPHDQMQLTSAAFSGIDLVFSMVVLFLCSAYFATLITEVLQDAVYDYKAKKKLEPIRTTFNFCPYTEPIGRVSEEYTEEPKA